MFFRRKAKASEREVAAAFVVDLVTKARDQWPAIIEQLRGLVPTVDALEVPTAKSEYALACIAVQMQALPNLLSPEQASRICRYALACLATDALDDLTGAESISLLPYRLAAALPGEGPADALERYQATWDEALRAVEPPQYAVASLLLDRLELETAVVNVGDQRIKDPLVLIALGGAIVTCGGPWWKKALSSLRLVP